MLEPSVEVVTSAVSLAFSQVERAALYPPGPIAGVKQSSADTAAETPATKSRPEAAAEVVVGKVEISVRS